MFAEFSSIRQGSVRNQVAKTMVVAQERTAVNETGTAVAAQARDVGKLEDRIWMIRAQNSHKALQDNERSAESGFQWKRARGWAEWDAGGGFGLRLCHGSLV